LREKQEERGRLETLHELKRIITAEREFQRKLN